VKTRSFFVIALVLSVACSSAGPDPKLEREPASRPSEKPFPPHGAVELRFAPPPPEGALYQLLVKYEGRTENQPQGKDAERDAQSIDELLQLELDYHQLPVASASQDDVATSLVLDSLRRRVRLAPPGSVHTIELADDRLRVIQNDKIDLDLRGAQPKGDITPRVLLKRPFALLVSDRFGNPKGVTLRGIPSAKRMLATMPLRETLGYLQVSFPDHPVAAGDDWTAKRYFASPAGRVGIGVDLEYRLVGFEKLEGVPCARVSLRASRDEEKVPSALGFTFDQVRLQLNGDAWIGLETGLVEMVRLQDLVAVSYNRSTPGTPPARIRMRYETHASLQRLHVETTAKLDWADGTKRFVDVEKGKSLGLKGAQ
jgi:hypothetical protein